ncbi:CEP76 C2 domain-containing protein [Paraphysoderma sedebokerense]|nr:CEP76 C2 domain-containing protein [Paraphysoderma sedebokerense]
MDVPVDESRISEWRTAVSDQIKRNRIQERIRGILEIPSVQREDQSIVEEEIKRDILEQGIIEDIICSLKKGNKRNQNRTSSTENKAKSEKELLFRKLLEQRSSRSVGLHQKQARSSVIENIKSNQQLRSIKLDVFGGKAFVSELDDNESLPSQITVHILALGQRFATKPVKLCVEPVISESFEIQLPSASSSTQLLPQVLSIQPIHFVLTRTNDYANTRLLGVAQLDCSDVLHNGVLKKSIEVTGIGSDASVSIGVLEVKVQAESSDLMAKEDLRQLMEAAKLEHQESTRLFFAISKSWWKEYTQIRPNYEERLIKLFAQSEFGTSMPVPTFIEPVKSRQIESPKHAARFVSLIEYDKHKSISGTTADVWQSFHATLVLGKGNIEDHAILLCSLLRGFELDAYVTIGLDANNQPHTWVTVVTAKNSVIFYESITGARYVLNDDTPFAPKYPYKTVDCLFSHKKYYGNCQPSNEISKVDFNLNDEAKWKQLDLTMLSRVTWHHNPPIQLVTSKIDTCQHELALEKELKHMFSAHLEIHERSCTWCTQLSSLMYTALSNYENERLLGSCIGQEEFEEGIRRSIPVGCLFKAFPTHFTYTSPQRIFTFLIKFQQCKELLSTRGDQIRFCLAVKCVKYVERVACWVMVGVRYRKV